MTKIETTITKEQIKQLYRAGKFRYVRFVQADGQSQFEGTNEPKDGPWEPLKLPETTDKNSQKLYLGQILDLHEF